MTAYALPRSQDSLQAALALCTGALFLLARSQVIGLGTARTAILALLYIALAVVSLGAVAPEGRGASLPVLPVTLVGTCAVIAVTYAPWQLGPSAAYGLAGLALGALAAVAEEAFFRRLLYGWLERWWGAPVAVVLSALAFALVHVPLYGVSVLWLDFGAGLLLSWQRWASGSWGAPAATHVVANVMAVAR